MSGLLIHDRGGGRLGVMTDLRASFEVRTGALCLLERALMVRSTGGPPVIGVVVPEGLAPLLRERLSLPVNDFAALERLKPEATITVLHGGYIGPMQPVVALKPGESIVDGGELVAARLPRDAALRALRDDGEAETASSRPITQGAGLLRRPWDVVRFRDAALLHDLRLLAYRDTATIPPGVTWFGRHEVSLDVTARVYPTAVFDLEHGPIVIGPHAVIRPGAIIVGPASIGAGSVIADRAHIKANTAIGPMCKIGGEVGGTIIQGYSNKSHDGHLGDAWLGEWVNLGAGTTNSNLLNTYGEVTARADAAAPNERTGLAFLGCCIGDHVKAAIGTRIMTGAVVGTGTMFAASAHLVGAVRPFRWITDAGDKPYAFPKFFEVATAMMARRKVAPSEAYAARLKALHGAAAAAG
jgi:UDP-N-acetylglucosamine diphosphorylase/glucosamine-1-phosphate N-acetyltransferase